MSNDKQVEAMIQDVNQVLTKTQTIPDPRLRAATEQALAGYRDALVKQKAAWSNQAVNSPERVTQMQGHINRAHEPVQTATQALSTGYKRDQGQGWGGFKEIAPQLKSIMNQHVQYAQGMSPQVQEAVMTIQERLYGVKINLDPNGRPILTPLPSQAELASSYGLDRGINQEQEIEPSQDLPGYTRPDHF